MKYFYEKSNINEFDTNITYHELLSMSIDEFDLWADRLRTLVISQWDIDGIPPVIGKNENEIIESFQKLRSYDVNSFITEDYDSLGIIRNFNKDASAVNQFFPTMLKTKISVGKTSEGATSIYDYFSLPELKERFKKAMLRTVKKDSMYSYSKSLSSHQERNDVHYDGESAKEWIQLYHDNKHTMFGEYGVWLCKIKSNDLNNNDYPSLSAKCIEELKSDGIIDDVMLSNIDELVDGEMSKGGKIINYKYLIRYYKKDQKIFPAALQVFRLGLTQPAVNFPSLTAKFLYEKYTEHIDEDGVIVYDPSAGWGGRILGAMSTGRKVHYVGTDPNTDNIIDEIGMSRYEYLANFYLNNCIDNYNGTFNKFFKATQTGNTYDIFSDGSELIRNNQDFQKYKGKIDMVFTSPPYFNREQYSNDKSQSFKAYPKYEDWKDGFLKPTLETAYEWLRPDRFIVLNIADIQIGKNVYYSLEQDSIDILTDLGCEYKGKLKMLMSRMIGLNPKGVKNSWYDSVEKKYFKYEPILVCYKP